MSPTDIISQLHTLEFKIKRLQQSYKKSNDQLIVFKEKLNTELLNINNILKFTQISCIYKDSWVKDNNLRKKFVCDMEKFLNFDETKSIDFVNFLTTNKYLLGYVGSGSIGHIFRICDGFGKDSSMCVKFSPYKKQTPLNIDHPHRDINSEFVMLNKLRKFVGDGRTPHIVLPIAKTLINMDMFDEYNTNFSGGNSSMKKFITGHKNNNYHDVASAIFMEYFPEGSFYDVVKHTEIDKNFWKPLFFQLLFTLALIHEKYPFFRHNDLKPNNILLRKVPIKTDYYVLYGNKYKVLNNGYHVILFDFDWSCIKGIVPNLKVDTKWCKTLNVISNKNRYYDLYYFFNCLRKKHWTFGKYKTAPKSTRDFINRIAPRRVRHSEKGRSMSTKEYTTPKKLIEKDRYFEEYRVA